MRLLTLAYAACGLALAACGGEKPAVAAPPAPASVPAPLPTPPAPAPAVEATHIPAATLIGDVDPAKNPDFTRIPTKYLGGSRVYGHKDAVAGLVKMIDAAAKEGIDIKIVSAFRSFKDQKTIWENKWTGKTLVEGGKLPKTVPDPKARATKILEFSAMPGTSRHHWGTDFDLNSLNNSYFAAGKGKKLYDWLNAHAVDYGFCQTYSAKGASRPAGYEEEKWHWSYLPVASLYLKQYPVDVGYDRLTGFLGSDAAKAIDVIPNYVQGINPKCKQ